ncbi:hypothetical protein B9J78_02280 [bacterium Unc6]|nr:hypothetical protein [bacterium Unc6]
MENKQIADIFSEVADILDILGENQFKVRAYRNAARVIEDYPERMEDIFQQGKELKSISCIGQGSAEKIQEIVSRGKLSYLEELLQKVPEGLIVLMRLEGLGPKKVKIIYDKLGIKDIESLYQALKEGRIKDLPGMGEKTEQNLIKAIKHFKDGQGRIRLDVAMEIADGLIKYLKQSKSIKRLEVVGSLRRRKETIKDIDILAIVDDPSSVMDRFVKFPDVQSVLSKGQTKSSIKLLNGVNVDIRVLEQKSFGAGMHYFTGSKEHNIAIRDRGKKQGLKISEYGIFRAEDEYPLGGAAEEEIFKSVDLQFIPPELRENRGEIEQAEKASLPKLIELKDIKADLQVHTVATDGRDTIEQMAEKAISLGYSYLAITDHSKEVKIAHGLDDKQLLKHIENIRKISERFKNFNLLTGIEVDILEDGNLDISDEVLRQCQIVIGAVHYHTKMGEEQMTKRIIKAMKNSYLNILGHPTGRIIMGRESYAVNIKDIIKCAVDYNVIFEINAHPQRLDLNDINTKLARDMGAKFVISTDAHSTSQMEHMRFGIFVARRGWLDAKDVINTLPLDKMLKTLKR